MHTAEVFLLPPPDPNRAPNEPVTHLLEALDHIAATPCTAAKDADERRELLYLTAAASLANTYPDEQQTVVYDRYAARCDRLSVAEQRTATLVMHGLASDLAANGVRHRDGHTWAAAAIAALEQYRTRKGDRVINTVVGRSPQVPA